eukprot:jgi/Ulvmu1/3821/UM018_0032.1
MADATQVRRPDLAHLVRQAAHGGTGAMVALPSQRQDFWECETVQNSLSQIASSISAHFRALGVGQHGAQDDLVAAIEVAASRALQESRSDLVTAILSDLRPELAQDIGSQDDVTDAMCQDELWAGCDIRSDSHTLSDASFGGPAVMAKLETLATVPDPAAVLQKLCSSYDIVDLADGEPAMFEAGLKNILSAGVSATQSAEVHFQKAFDILTSTVDGRTLRLRIMLEHLLAKGNRPRTIDLSGVLLRVLSLIPESIQSDPDADTVAMAGVVTQALLECLVSNLRGEVGSVPISSAAGILARDPTMKWWTRLLAMPQVALHVIPAALSSGIVKLALDSIHSCQAQAEFRSTQSGVSPTAQNRLLPAAACIVLLSMMASRSREEAWLQAMQASLEVHAATGGHDATCPSHGTPAAEHELQTGTGGEPATSCAMSEDSGELDTATAPCMQAATPSDVMPVILDQAAQLTDPHCQVSQLEKMFRCLSVSASLLPELMHSLDGTLALLLRSHLDVLAGRSLSGARDPASHTAGGAAASAAAAQPHAAGHEWLANAPGSSDAGDDAGEDAGDAVAERVCGFAGVVAVLGETSSGCDTLCTASGDGTGGGPAWPTALAAWLQELPAVAPVDGPHTTAMLTSWLVTICSIARRPHACTYHLLPVFHAIPPLLDALAQAAGFSRSGSTSSGGSAGVMESICDIVEQVAALVADAPLAAAAILDDRQLSARACALLVSYLTHALAAGVAAVVLPRPQHASAADARGRRAGASGAAAALRAMAALQCVRSRQHALVAAGVDAVLVRALLCAPRCRCGDDEDALMSGATVTIVRLIRARMRWPGAAAVAAAGPAASLDEPRSALLALLKALYVGSDTRLSDLCAFEDRRLVLACLLQPWLASEACSTLLSSIVPSPLLFIKATSAAALGMPGGTSLLLPPPASQDPPCTCPLTCGHKPPPVPCGDRDVDMLADDGANAGGTALRSTAEFLPFGLKYVADRAVYASIRMSLSPACRAPYTGPPSTEERGHKRIRLHERQRGPAAGQGDQRISGDATQPSAVASAVAAVAMSDPGMHEGHAWWRTAAAVLAALFTDPEGPLSAAGVAGRPPAAGRAAGWAGLGPCCHDVALVLQRVVQVAMASPGAEGTAGKGGILPDITLPTQPPGAILTGDQMQLLAMPPDLAPGRAPHPASTSAVAGPAAGALQLPPLLPADNPALAKWISQAQDLLRSLGMASPAAAGYSMAEGSLAAAAGGFGAGAHSPLPASEAAVALASIQQAASVACGHHRTASALPDADVFVLLMLALHGGSVGRLPPALAAAAAAPVGRFVWPAYAAAVYGPAPLRQLAAAARIVLAREDRALFTALERAHLTNDILLHWLRALLLPVLTVPAASAVVALTLVHGPLMLAATAVALLCVLRPAVLQRAVAPDKDELREWLLAVHCFDADASALLAQALDIEARHRVDLLPLLLNPYGMR